MEDLAFHQKHTNNTWLKLVTQTISADFSRWTTQEASSPSTPFLQTINRSGAGHMPHHIHTQVTVTQWLVWQHHLWTEIGFKDYSKNHWLRAYVFKVYEAQRKWDLNMLENSQNVALASGLVIKLCISWVVVYKNRLSSATFFKFIDDPHHMLSPTQWPVKSLVGPSSIFKWFQVLML